jgi:hypothetical protein
MRYSPSTYRVAVADRWLLESMPPITDDHEMTPFSFRVTCLIVMIVDSPQMQHGQLVLLLTTCDMLLVCHFFFPQAASLSMTLPGIRCDARLGHTSQKPSTCCSFHLQAACLTRCVLCAYAHTYAHHCVASPASEQPRPPTYVGGY